MKEQLNHLFSSKKTTIVLLIVYAFLMGAATIIEKYQDTETAKALIYYSPLFFLVHILMIINFVSISYRYYLKRLNLRYLLIHGSFMIILIGATVTHFFSKEGMLHLREGQRTAQLVMSGKSGGVTTVLPFEVELTKFHLIRYPGSQSPSSYESDLKIHKDGEVTEHKIYMNNVLDMDGYRFYQASYDPDETGSILSVNYDTVGRNITYTGYLILFIGLLGALVDKKSRFRKLAKLLKRSSPLLIGLFLLSPQTLHAAQAPQSWINSHARSLSELPVQSVNGRIVPLHTLTSEVLRKVYGAEQYRNIPPDRLLLSLIAHPEQWVDEPIIKVNNKSLPYQFQWDKEYISYRDAFDEQGSYILGAAVADIYRKSPTQRTLGEREILKLDEKINVYHMLLRFQLLRIFPLQGDSIHHRWLAPTEDLSNLNPSEREAIGQLFLDYRLLLRDALNGSNATKADEALDKIKAYQQLHNTGIDISKKRMTTEVSYNNLNLRRICQKGYLILGALLLLLSFYPPKRNPRLLKVSSKILTAGILLFWLLHTADMGMRWYIAGYAPWSNSYETMVSLSWASVLGGMILCRHDLTAMALSTLFGGIALFVSGLSWMDPHISPLVPVLKSPWLTFHVAVLILSYGFLGISCMIGTTNLCLNIRSNGREDSTYHRIRRLSIISEMSMIAGVIFLYIGIFLGAIWANESWGRYWSWDPKETWALITAIIYTAVLHYRWFWRKRNDRIFSLLSQLSFLTVLMTFLGVNYLLSGMHSYGNTTGLSGASYIGLVLLTCFFVLPGLISTYFTVRRRKR